MKITGIRVHVLRSESEAFPNESLVRILTDEGIEGNCLIESVYAEELVRRFAAGSSTYLAGAWNIGAERLERLIGADPLFREKLEDSWRAQYFWSPINNPASCAFNECLWDIAGKVFRLPIYKLIGAHRERIPAYASTQFYEREEEYISLAEKLKSEGYRAMKLHPTRDWKKDISLCKAVRKTVGDEMTLMLDPLNSYSREQALRVGREIDKLNFYWFEDPILPTDIDGLADLCSSLDVRILMGEHMQNLRGYTEYIRRHAADSLRCWDVNVGGITPMLEIANLAEAFGMKCEIVSWGNPLRQAAALHVMLAVRNCDFFELPIPAGTFDRGFADHIRISNDGQIEAPTKPGLGVEIDWNEIEKATMKTLAYP